MQPGTSPESPASQAAFTYAYDNARNRVSMTDGNAHTTSYQYDARKRLVLTAYPDGTTKTNTYDGPGNLISVTDQAGNVVEYTYDAANEFKRCPDKQPGHFGQYHHRWLRRRR